MGHRHPHNAPHIPEANGDQGWNHANQSYNPFAMAGPFGSSSLVLPVDNMTIQGGYFPSSVPRSSGHSSSIPNTASAPYQPEAPFPQQLAVNNYLHHPSSSSLSGQTVPSLDELFYIQAMGSGAHKRKTPCVPHLSDKGSTSRLHDVGSSSSLHSLEDEWQMYQPPGYRSNSLHVSGEPMPRNVRIRAEVEPAINPFRTTQPSYQPDSVGLWRQSSNTQLGEGNHCLVQPFAGHGANSGAGSGMSSHNPTSNRNLVPQNANCNENPNQPILNFMAPSSNFQLGQATASNGRLQIAAQSQPFVGSGMSSYNPISNRNPVPQNANCYVNPNQPILDFMAPSSNFHVGQATASNGRLQMVAQSQPSRQRSVFSTVRLTNGEGHGRTGIPRDMHRSYAQEALMAAHHSIIHGSRNPLDHHRDMRLDVDNMSYEELLVLGERIGSVGTGLSDSSISKCLTESIFVAPDQYEDDDGRCVICLEEYIHMDDVGILKCRHDFHVVCIKKWLSLKNLCPICKSSAMD